MSKIRTIRKRLGVTQQALADGIGCVQGNVSFYEKGQSVPPLVAQRLIEFCKSRGLSIGFDHIYGDAALPEVANAETACTG